MYKSPPKNAIRDTDILGGDEFPPRYCRYLIYNTEDFKQESPQTLNI
ncbi:hypothetical protein CWATWH8502_4808 [Crocosphaera watsonii WH 8502]|uniref:Uncharacterized protein n=1 Tax=Crocosphaera watsonii WH 8502 TaxID=423474 RepID=T2IGS8_CROWT|nr:hypothetical protein CWATWH8502_4808 [Crocosphaera watsonii WH 8502]